MPDLSEMISPDEWARLKAAATTPPVRYETDGAPIYDWQQEPT